MTKQDALNKTELDKLVSEAFKRYRDGDLWGLTELPLAYSPVIERCLFTTPDQASQTIRARALQSVLRWMVDKLKPGGVHSWTATRWRYYNILYHFYLHETKISELAHQMAIAEQTWYQLRSRAITAATSILEAELTNPQHTTELKTYLIADYYTSYQPSTQQVWRLLAIFRQPAPSQWLYDLINQTQIQSALQTLLPAHLISSNPQRTAFFVKPDIRAYLLTLLSPTEREQWHNTVAHYYYTETNYLEAAWHWQQAQAYTAAAKVLIEHYQTLINQLNIEALQIMLATFQPTHIQDKNLWAELKIVEGQVASHLEDVETAIEHYREALGATDVHIKSRAYFYRGQAYKFSNIDEALAHYRYCIQLLEHDQAHSPLLGRALIETVWIFIHHRQDLAMAQTTLEQVKQLLKPEARHEWSDLHNAWAELSYRQQDLSGAIEHQLQAWLAANETQDVDKMIRTGHNLGQFYTENQQYEQGLTYLRQCQTLAKQAGNRIAEGACFKSIGACYFWLEDYQTAITQYQTAYNIFKQTGDLTLQASTCYDLAEAYSVQGRPNQGQQFFDQGLTLAQSIGYKELVEAFEALANQQTFVVAPTDDLNERQHQALLFIRTHGAISNRQYRELTGISQKQAVRDLKNLVAKKILAETGQGRARRYILRS